MDKQRQRHSGIKFMMTRQDCNCEAVEKCHHSAAICLQEHYIQASTPVVTIDL